MSSALDTLSSDVRGGLPKGEMPAWAEPMLATLTHEPFSNEDWIYERKLDGERCLAVRRRGRVHLYSRNHKQNDATWPEIRDALAERLEEDCIVDGEIVAFEGNVTSFARLQQRMGLHDEGEARASGVRVLYYVFDVLWVGSRDLRDLALRRRKRVLRGLFEYEDPIRFTPHRNGSGEAYLDEACRKGWEGIIAKRASSRYEAKRSREWLKLKCHGEQEFVVGGFTDSEAGDDRIGALLLGTFEGDALRYHGKVGTGFDDHTRRDLRERLERQERKTSPFEDGDGPNSKVHWTTPDLVVQVAFTEWTRAGRLRHPRYLGIREDKRPASVHREKTHEVEG